MKEDNRPLTELSFQELVDFRKALWYAAAEYIECCDHIRLVDAEIVRRKSKAWLFLNSAALEGK